MKSKLQKAISQGMKNYWVAKKSKYGNIKTTTIQSGEEIVYDSKKEAKAGSYLRYLQAEGTISDLKRQVPFKIVINNYFICTYYADFTYIRDGKFIVLDVKSELTRKNPVYRLKKKLLKALHGIDITEVI